jgi:hypothetical protein
MIRKTTLLLISILSLISCRTLPLSGLSSISIPSNYQEEEENPPNIVITDPAVKSISVTEYTDTEEFKIKAPIDGHTYISDPAQYLDQHPQRNFILQASTQVAFKNSKPQECKLVASQKNFFDHDEDEDIDAQEFPVIRAAELFANTVHQKSISTKDGLIFMELDFYECAGISTRKNPTSNLLKTKSSQEFDWLIGAYVDRTGLLKQLGKTGPTAGINIQFFTPKGNKVGTKFTKGWYLHASFDHFFDTDSTLLKPKFYNADYTNYLWSAGWAGRYLFNKNFQVNYLVGPALNFLEIDTNRYNTELSDEEATRTSISFIHQLSFHYRVDNNMKSYGSIKKESDVLLGMNLLYYWMPDALGSFAANNSSAESYGGGSLAVMLSLKFQGL